MSLIFELDLYRVKLDQLEKYLGQNDTQTDTQTEVLLDLYH